MSDKLKVGLFGFGCVGQGLYDVANDSQGIEATLSKVCVKDKDKVRSIDASYFTYDQEEILERNDLDVIVELINDSVEAFQIVDRSLGKGNDVVSANKKLIAENFRAIYDQHINNGGSILYEGAVGGSIPIIRNLEEYYDNDLLTSVRGIVNGSCNYILSKMELDQQDYSVALEEATKEGFAELDPWLDVAAYDSKYKLVILAIHAFGIILDPKEVLNLGIQNVSTFDINYAQDHGYRIKLLAMAYKFENKYRFYVIPQFVRKSSNLYDISYENNAVEVENNFRDKQLLVGKGAGSHPTGAAVLSDISALTYGYKYGYRKLKKKLSDGVNDFSTLVEEDYYLKVYIRYTNKEVLKKLEIKEVYETFSSKDNNYIVSDVAFKSLFNVMDDRNKEIFIVAF